MSASLPILVTIFISFWAVAYVIYRKSQWKTLEPLLTKEYNFGKRQKTFKRAIGLLDERNARCLIETGVARYGLRNSKSDGASTAVFGLWAKANQCSLYSVDISPESIAGARVAVDELNLSDQVKLVTGDSVQFLENFSEPVDFLYLDSYDYDKRDESVQIASQTHHLNEFRAIEEQLGPDSVVLLDDCDLPGGGKGKAVIEYMIRKGWQIDTSAYQVLLTKIR